MFSKEILKLRIFMEAVCDCLSNWKLRPLKKGSSDAEWLGGGGKGRRYTTHFSAYFFPNPRHIPFLSRFPVLVTQITFSKCKYRKMPTTKGSLYHSFFSPYHSIFLQAVHNITCPVLNENALVYSREVWFKYTKFPKYMLRFYFQPFSGRPSYFRFFWEKLS